MGDWAWMDTVVGHFQLGQEPIKRGLYFPHYVFRRPFYRTLSESKRGLSIWFHAPSAERANQNRGNLAYPSLFLTSVIGDGVERVMTFCRKVLIRWMFPRQIGSEFPSCHKCEELAAATEWKFKKSTRQKNKIK